MVLSLGNLITQQASPLLGKVIHEVTMEHLTVKILGTRGSMAAALPQIMSYGGNTQCVAASCEGEGLIFDGGTGLLTAAAALNAEGCTQRYPILLTHYHLDHIMALALFTLCLPPHAVVDIYGPSYEGRSCRELLNHLFQPPFWPVALPDSPPAVNFHTIEAGQRFSVGGYTLNTASLCHPDGSIGYRISRAEKSFCYIFDHEQDACDSDHLVPFMEGCDLLLCDASSHRAAYSASKGFGHSSAETMLEAAQRARVKKAVLGHHPLTASDADLDKLEAYIKGIFPFAEYAKEGMVFHI